VGSSEPAEVGHSLQVPDDDAWLHLGGCLMAPKQALVSEL
jgi:hypothetical protein